MHVSQMSGFVIFLILVFQEWKGSPALEKSLNFSLTCQEFQTEFSKVMKPSIIKTMTRSSFFLNLIMLPTFQSYRKKTHSVKEMFVLQI